MKRIHIIGGKNHGKTTLVIELVEHLSSQGYRVGTIKHTHHQHELDAPGKDSFRHREAGAGVVGILSRSMNALFWQPPPAPDSSSDERYEAFSPAFEKCHLVIVEGDTQTTATKIEVWRKSLGTQPLAATDASIKAVITHDECPSEVTAPTWPRADIHALAENILKHLELQSP